MLGSKHQKGQKPQNHSYKITVLGAPRSGKTVLCAGFVQNAFLEHYIPTIEDEYKKEMAVDDEKAEMEIYDMAGWDEQQLQLFQQRILKADGILYVYDITSLQSFTVVQDIEQKVSELKDGLLVPSLVVGTKTDLEIVRAVSQADGQQFATLHSFPFMEISVKENMDSARESFHTLIRDIKKVRDNQYREQEERRKAEEQEQNAKRFLSFATLRRGTQAITFAKAAKAETTIVEEAEPTNVPYDKDSYEKEKKKNKKEKDENEKEDGEKEKKDDKKEKEIEIDKDENEAGEVDKKKRVSIRRKLTSFRKKQKEHVKPAEDSVSQENQECQNSPKVNEGPNICIKSVTKRLNSAQIYNVQTPQADFTTICASPDSELHIQRSISSPEHYAQKTTHHASVLPSFTSPTAATSSSVSALISPRRVVSFRRKPLPPIPTLDSSPESARATTDTGVSVASRARSFSTSSCYAKSPRRPPIPTRPLPPNPLPMPTDMPLPTGPATPVESDLDNVLSSLAYLSSADPLERTTSFHTPSPSSQPLTTRGPKAHKSLHVPSKTPPSARIPIKDIFATSSSSCPLTHHKHVPNTNTTTGSSGSNGLQAS